MSINWSEIATALEGAAQFIESPAITALAALGGPVAEGIVATVQGIASASTGIIATVATAVPAIESGDLATIQTADAKIQTANIALAQQIAAL